MRVASRAPQTSTAGQAHGEPADCSKVDVRDNLATLCVACRRRLTWNPHLRLEQLCDRCWRLIAPRLVEEAETLLPDASAVGPSDG